MTHRSERRKGKIFLNEILVIPVELDVLQGFFALHILLAVWDFFYKNSGNMKSAPIVLHPQCLLSGIQASRGEVSRIVRPADFLAKGPNWIIT